MLFFLGDEERGGSGRFLKFTGFLLAIKKKKKEGKRIIML